MPAHFTPLDLAVLVIYFLLVMGTGFYFLRKSRSVDGFTAAGRSLPGWVVGFSILATYVSSISFLANPGKSFATNWNPFVFGLSMPVATWIAVRYFLPYYRAGTEVSAYSHLEKRFGPWARIYVGSLYLLTQLARIGIVMYLMALPLSVLLDWKIEWIIIFTGVSVTLYTFVGGIVAVIWTDAIQCIILMGGALLCLIVMLGDLPGGIGQLVEVAVQHDKFSLGSFGFSLTEPTFWVTLFYGVVINLNNFGIDQNYVQRYIASKSDREASKSLWLGGMLFIPLSAVFFLIGTTLFVYYQVLGTPADLPNKADQVFPYFIVTALPPGLTGLLIAAVFAAAMSTVSTSLNSSATLVLTDIYQRYINRSATEKQSMRVLYIATVVWGGLGTLLGLAVIGQESALDAWWILSGIFSGGMIGLFLTGRVVKKADNPAAVTAICIGTLVILWMTLPKAFKECESFLGPLPPFLKAIKSPFDPLLIPVFGTATIVLVGLLIGLLRHKNDAGRSEGD